MISLNFVAIASEFLKIIRLIIRLVFILHSLKVFPLSPIEVFSGLFREGFTPPLIVVILHREASFRSFMLRVKRCATKRVITRVLSLIGM